MDRSTTAAIVMAAGKGTRFRSDLAKVLHRAAGRTLLGHILEAIRPLGLGQVVVVVGHQSDDVATEAEASGLAGLTTVVQEPQHGTAHAVEVALPSLAPGIERVLVLNGDVPLLTSRTLADLADTPEGSAAVLTAVLDDATGYGRVLRDHGGVSRIVEHRDATAEERRVTEVNAGMYALDRDGLDDLLAACGTANDQGERYLTDVVGLLVDRGTTVLGQVADPTEVAGVNDRAQLAMATAALHRRHAHELMRDGVAILDPGATYIDVTVTIERDAVVLPGSILEGTTHVAQGATVGPQSHLVDTLVEAGAVVRNSVCDQAEIGPDATVGPFTYLRPGAHLRAGAKTGAFVEVKKSVIGEGSKVPHLSYVGDATIGRGVNFACGAVTVNYDGTSKYQTVVGDGAFVGCDTMLVAPVTVGEGAFIAAGSTITEDVPPGALAIARARQTVKDGWASRRQVTPTD